MLAILWETVHNQKVTKAWIFSVRGGVQWQAFPKSWHCQNWLNTPLPPGVSGNDFWTFGNGNGNGSAHSQTLGTGTGMINCIPNFWEREREWKFHSQFLGTGMEIPFPNFGNGNETLLFPGMTGNGNGNGIAKLSESFFVIPYNWYCDENHDKRR